MADIFSADRISRFDKQGVREAYAAWPGLARDGKGIKVELGKGSYKRAYVLAMGGSASGGDVVASWMSAVPGFEMAVFKGQLPLGDMKNSIAIACSASGQTEETLEMLKTAVDRRATVVSMSAGGVLMDEAHRLGIPHVKMPEVLAPRYVLPFIVFSILAVVASGFGLDCDKEADDAIHHMEAEWGRVGPGNTSPHNPSKDLARLLLDKTPAIYGARITRGVGIRFKNVLNENAKKHALFDGIPDAFHNEVEAWEDATRGFIPIFLRHSEEVDRDRRKTDKMLRILEDAGTHALEVRGAGSSSLGQLMSMAYRLDVASYYLAVGLGRDPYPIRLIDRLKKPA